MENITIEYNIDTSVRHPIKDDDIVWAAYITSNENADLQDKELVG